MILVVGDGAVAQALAGALANAGDPPARWSRRGGGPIPVAEVAILAVRDEAVAEVAALVRETQSSTVLLHCAGALTVPGAALLHPLRSFSGAPGDAELRGTVFAVEGDDPGRAAALAIVAKLGGVPLILDALKLARYHAAAALVSNGTVGLVAAGAALLESVGLDRARAIAALTALLASTLRNLEELGLPNALTGPIARGDAAVVERHLGALDDADLYREVMKAVTKVAREKGRATPDALARIAGLLDGN